MTLALLPPTYKVSSFYLLRIYKLGFLFSKHITTALVWDPAVSCRVYCNRLPIYFPQCYQSDLSKNAILSCQFKKKKIPSHSFRTKFKLFHLAYVVFRDLSPACHTNFISIVLDVLATLNYLPLFVNAILANKSPNLSQPLTPLFLLPERELLYSPRELFLFLHLENFLFFQNLY